MSISPFSGNPDDVSRKSVARFKTWINDLGVQFKERCPGKYQTVIRDICLIGVDLLPNVTRSRALFANKLDIKDQPVALECLHDWIRDRVMKEYRNPNASYIDVSYYRSLDFVKKHVMPYWTTLRHVADHFPSPFRPMAAPKFRTTSRVREKVKTKAKKHNNKETGNYLTK